MWIRVIYMDKSVGLVKRTQLGELLRTGDIAAICREEGWTKVRRDRQGGN